jgi:NitT/TauT family transport system substrate-binding protein
MNRRDFVRDLTLAGALLGARPRIGAAEPPPETSRIRLGQVPSVCVSPQYVAEELLRAEGFTDVSYVEMAGGLPGAKATGEGRVDVSQNFAAPLVMSLDAGDALVLLGGVHVGCFELFATGRVRTIRDLKGKTVAVFGIQSGQHVFLASMMTQVGLDPRTDVTWVVHPPDEAKRLLAEGKIDAYLGFPPDPQELRAKKVGHVIVNSAVDRPWSQYFCCMVSANREFVQKHPVAAKRALRAILKSDQICALEPERAVRAFLGRGFKANPEYALQAVKAIPFGRWREYNPEETIRFYALRLREAGMITSSPQKILAQGTDWRFLNELKKELKG